MEKIADPFFFCFLFCPVIFLSGVMPFEEITLKSCQQDISKSI